MYKIPLTTNPNQTFSCTIPINGKNKELKFKLWYNLISKYWNMTLIDAKTNTEILSNVPLLSSKYIFYDLFKQVDYKKIGMCVVFPLVDDRKSMADDKNLGSNYIMLWGDNDV